MIYYISCPQERAHSITVTLERSGVHTSLVHGAKPASMSKETSKEASELKHPTALTKPTKEAFDVHRLKRDRAGATIFISLLVY
jgi:hypothetical protein